MCVLSNAYRSPEKWWWSSECFIFSHWGNPKHVSCAVQMFLSVLTKEILWELWGWCKFCVFSVTKSLWSIISIKTKMDDWTLGLHGQLSRLMHNDTADSAMTLISEVCLLHEHHDVTGLHSECCLTSPYQQIHLFLKTRDTILCTCA